MVRTYKDFDLRNRSILLRADLDAPGDEEGKVKDTYRLEIAAKTIKTLIKLEPKQIVIIGHRGRPEGHRSKKDSLEKVCIELMKLVGRTIAFVPDCRSVDIPNEKIVMLENLRFHVEEDENNEGFAHELASYAEIFINDAFASHNKGASILTIPQFLPSAIGPRFLTELESLHLDHAQEPIVAIIGGAKVHDKMPLFKNLLKYVEKIYVGGAMMYTFLAVKGYETGKSIIDEEGKELASILINNDKLVLPTDTVVLDGKEVKTVSVSRIPKTAKGLDVGFGTLDAWYKELKQARTVVWNGPLGFVEDERFAKQTINLANILVKLPARTIIGGGDTVKVLQKLGVTEKFFHVSSGGGAALRILGGQEHPGVTAIAMNENIKPNEKQ
ncbi:MAG: phosphoglycerate kinase [Candidatus Woesearchaeota archaeon]|nr:MAG: phosphoglycerate kinase [Candidatus Woesearchaeota archaeon]